MENGEEFIAGIASKKERSFLGEWGERGEKEVEMCFELCFFFKKQKCFFLS